MASVPLQIIKKHESGYWSGNGNLSGETYLGIDRKYNSNWEGWKIIDAYKKNYGIPPRFALIKSQLLDENVKEFYSRYLGELVDLGSLANQPLQIF
jgi:hypothetical protein